MTVPGTTFSCLRHFRQTCESLTADTTAHSDCGRAHRAFASGYDKFKKDGQVVFVKFEPVCPEGITYSQYEQWRDGLLNPGYKPTTMDTYVFTMERCWNAVKCDCARDGEIEVVSFGDSDADDDSSTSGETSPKPKSPNSSGEAQPSRSGADMLADLIAAAIRGNKKSRGQGGGFRVSHAQKSLSLTAKHAWINGVIPMPPFSVIDRIILDRASAITGRGWVRPWTHVNDIEEWQAHFDLILQAAGKMPVAAWELIQFERDGIASGHQWWEAENLANLDEEVEKAKKSFMNRFKSAPGDPEWPAIMLKDAIRSAVGRNPLYADGVPEQSRAAFREAWRNWLIDFLLRWKNLGESGQTVDQFRQEVSALCADMNGQFGQYFA